MNKHECIIGLHRGADQDSLMTVKKLEDEIKQQQAIYKYFYNAYIYSHPRKPYTIQDYTDLRKSTDLWRFNYCPQCGAKINWKELRKKYMEALKC